MEKVSEKNNEDKHLSSVKNALRILRSFSSDKTEKRVSELAAELGMTKSTVSRLLITLSSEGFVKKNIETQKYSLGLSVLSLGGIVKKQLHLTKESRPALMKLVKETGESAHLSILEGTEVIYIEIIESPHLIRILTHVGKRNPAFCTSSGNVLLSYQKEELIEQIIKNGLHQYTSKTVTDPQQFRNKIKSVREQGYCISVEQVLTGVVSVAAPIRNDTGEVIATVSLAGPIQRMNEKYFPSYKSKVIQAAKEISEALGYYR
jgi:IclR family transcriptional regulator, KDG regulon repressor